MKLARRPVLVTLLIGLTANAALAADNPQPVNQAQPPALQSGAAAKPHELVADPAAGLPDVPENQAEIQAIRRGELKLVQPDGMAPAPVVDAAREARRVAFDAVMAEQDSKIQTLADRLTGATGEAAFAIQKDIEREKLATSRRLLEVQLQFATGDGDQARVEQIQAALEAWDAPAPVYTPVERPLPAIQGR
jgi:hypothetical protein